MTAIITHRQSSGKIALMGKNLFLNKSISGLIIGFVLLYVGVSCGVINEEAVTTEPEQATIPTTIPTQAPDRVVLAAAGNTSAEAIVSAQSFIAQLAAESGLDFETRDSIMASEITPDIKVIVFLEQPENLGSLASSAPNTQFVAISSQDWNPPPNGNIIRINNDHAAFLAGYLSAMIAPNFRVGALQIAENNAFNQAFVNGVNYYCGICASVVFPYTTYPVVSQQPAGSPSVNWQSAFNEINLSKVNVLFLPQEAATPDLSAFLATQEIAVVGNAPPPEELRGKWVATVSSDGLTALREMWPDLLAGIGGKIINASLTFSDLNYLNIEFQTVGITQGKLLQLEEMIKLLRDGQVYPYTLAQ